VSAIIELIKETEARVLACNNLLAALTTVAALMGEDVGATIAAEPTLAKPTRRNSTKRKPARRKTAKAKIRRVAAPSTADDRPASSHAGDLTARRRLVLAQFKRHDMLTGKQLRKVVRFEGVADDQQAPTLQSVLTWLKLQGYIDRTASTWEITDKGKAAEL
jgi:hypothetical protein